MIGSIPHIRFTTNPPKDIQPLEELQTRYDARGERSQTPEPEIEDIKPPEPNGAANGMPPEPKKEAKPIIPWQKPDVPTTASIFTKLEQPNGAQLNGENSVPPSFSSIPPEGSTEPNPSTSLFGSKKQQAEASSTKVKSKRVAASMNVWARGVPPPEMFQIKSDFGRFENSLLTGSIDNIRFLGELIVCILNAAKPKLTQSDICHRRPGFCRNTSESPICQ